MPAEAVEREDFFEEPFAVEEPLFLGVPFLLDAPESDLVDPPELNGPEDFLAPPDAVRVPADSLFGLSFCLVAEAAFAELFFKLELDALVAVFDAPVFDELELFADLLVLDPPADLPADRGLP